jgi:exosome complex component RRP4
MDTDRIVLPGEVVAETTVGIMCGSGVEARDDKVIANVRGFVTRIGQLLSVTPMTSIYSPNVGDIVVGRVSAVQQQRWKVQIGCSVLANLRLTAIFLPDDQLRRRTTADERNMRQYFDVGDLVCAEIQDGGNPISLHTRQQHPRRLDNGLVIEVPSRLIKRVPNHIATLDLESQSFQVIYGMNGSIWLGPADSGAVMYVPRIRNCLVLLATYEQQISTDALCAVFAKTLQVDTNRIVSIETACQLGFVRRSE